MSRYLLLVILNAPLILAGVISSLVSFKLRRLTKSQFVLRIALWAVILLGLISAHFIYQFLFTNNLTQTEPLSLFDVIQITGIVLLFYVVSRYRTRIDALERRLQDLHRELSVRLSQK